MLLRYIRKKLANLWVNRWDRINRETRKTLMTFDTRVELYPVDLQKAKKLALLLSRKKYLTDGEYKKWYTYLTMTEKTEPEGLSDIEIV